MRVISLLAGIFACTISANAQAYIAGGIQCGGTVTGNNGVNGTHTIGQGAPEHWHAFTATIAGQYTFTTCTGTTYDSYLWVYTRTGATGIGSPVANNDDACGLQSTINVVLSAGLYWIVVEGWSTGTGNYQLSMTCPAGAGAVNCVSMANCPTVSTTVIGDISCGGTYTGSTVGATHTQGQGAPEHWFRFTSSALGGLYAFSPCGSSFDTFMYLYQRVGPATLIGSVVASRDDGVGPVTTGGIASCSSPLQGVLAVVLPPNLDYWVVIDGFSSSAGNYQLNVVCPTNSPTTSPTAVPTAAPTAAPTRTPIVSGTITCGSNITGTTAGAPHDVGPAAPENWWMFSSTRNGMYVFNTCGSTYDTYVHVFNRTTGSTDALLGRGALVASCDDYCAPSGSVSPCGWRTVWEIELDAGDYWIVVDGYSQSESGAYSMLTTCPRTTIEQPAQCATYTTGSTVNGTNTVNGGGSGNSAENWWPFVAQGYGTYTISTCNDATTYDTYVHVFERLNGDGVGAMVAYQDDAAPGRCAAHPLQTVLDVALTSGDYWVVMDGFSTSVGQYVFYITCPPAGASNPPTPAPTFPQGTAVMNPLPCGTLVTGNTTGAADTLGYPSGENWWPFTAPVTGPYIFDTCGSAFDTYLLVFQRLTNDATNMALGPLVVECDDCGPCVFRTVLTTNLTAGDYFLVVQGFSGAEGAYQVMTTCATNSPTSAPTVYGSPTTVAPTTFAPVPLANVGQPTTLAPVTASPFRSEAPTTAPTSAPTTWAPVTLLTYQPTSVGGNAGASGGGSSDGCSGFIKCNWYYIVVAAVAVLVLIGAIVYYKSGDKAEAKGEAANDRSAFSNPVYGDSGAATGYADVPPAGTADDGYLDVNERGGDQGEDLYEDGAGDDDF